MATGSTVFDFGYPAAGKYHGSDLTYCADQVFTDPLVANRTFGIDCDMTGGSSGGPWLFPFTESTGVGTIRAVNSYGYDSDQEGIRLEVQREHGQHVRGREDRLVEHDRQLIRAASLGPVARPQREMGLQPPV